MKYVRRIVVWGAAALGTVVVLFVALLAWGAWAALHEKTPEGQTRPQAYVDPDQRFRLVVPAGCAEDDDLGDDSAWFRCGTTWPGAPITYSYAAVTFGQGGAGLSDLQRLENRVINDWANGPHALKLRESNVRAKLLGRPARMMLGTLTDANAVRYTVRVIAAVGGGHWYTLSFISSDLQWPYDSAAYWKPILSSFRAS